MGEGVHGTAGQVSIFMEQNADSIDGRTRERVLERGNRVVASDRCYSQPLSSFA
jgi:hypothetical protein